MTNWRRKWDGYSRYAIGASWYYRPKNVESSDGEREGALVRPVTSRHKSSAVKTTLLRHRERKGRFVKSQPGDLEDEGI
ncbi:hypothetical protein PUN28_012198 [Cardiocondyla obscurior]|uniref:Uncharacterized protein n=1 Tax=Cardiocondyla obscurior TaxID=286306 RepID=A0AAW2FEZ8_9HYME